MSSITGGATPYAVADIQLSNCASPVAITGYSVIVQQEYQIQANSSGVINSTLWSNDVINCNGTTGNSQYMLSWLVNGSVQGTPQCYQVIQTQTWNLLTQQPIACSQSPPNPQDASFRNLNLSGCLSINGSSCTVSPYVSTTLTSPQTMAGPLVVPALNTILYPAPGTGTISAAWAANSCNSGGSCHIILGCGTYIDSVTISSSYNWIDAALCTRFQPTGNSTPIFILAQSGPSAGLYYNKITGGYYANPGNFTGVDAIRLTTNATGPHNDYNTIGNFYCSGFANCINMLGGTIWNTYPDVNATSNTNGISINTTQSVNQLQIVRPILLNNTNYGLFASVSNATTWHIQDPTIQGNGSAILSSNCAGLYITTSSGGLEGLTIDGQGYEENNCFGGDIHAASIRLTGSSVLSATITGQRFSNACGTGIQTNCGCGILADSTIGSGLIMSNEYKEPASTCGYGVKIINSDLASGSNWVVGPHTYINEGQGDVNFSGTGPMLYRKVAADSTMGYQQGLTTGLSASPTGIGIKNYGTFLHSFNAGTSTGTSGAVTATIVNNSIPNSATAGENCFNWQWANASLAVRECVYSTSSGGTPASSSGYRWYTENSFGNPFLAGQLDPTGLLNVNSGFTIGGAATSGNYLRGNGTKFLSGAIAAGDLPTVIPQSTATQTAGQVVCIKTTGPPATYGSCTALTAGTGVCSACN